MEVSVGVRHEWFLNSREVRRCGLRVKFGRAGLRLTRKRKKIIMLKWFCEVKNLYILKAPRENVVRFDRKTW